MPVQVQHCGIRRFGSKKRSYFFWGKRGAHTFEKLDPFELYR